jgi:glycosyltransferase involved in cell wall biosynthesis
MFSAPRLAPIKLSKVRITSSRLPRRTSLCLPSRKGFIVDTRKRLAIIVSHPIQYYAPLYQRLAQRSDLALRVFFTWHSARCQMQDPGFKLKIGWDIPLTQGYESELVPNVSPAPGMHHFFGLMNPSLSTRIVAWQPDIVHITGWAWCSHLFAMRHLAKLGIPTLFRGDSHLLDTPNPSGIGWTLKRALLKRVFSWPCAFLVVGSANRAYYQAFDVEADRLFPCTHSIDVHRFSSQSEIYEAEASKWRNKLGISPNQCVLLFAGKFEKKKCPVQLMQVIRNLPERDVILVMVGNGELGEEIRNIAATAPERFRVLPFQNQQTMPVVYRLGDLFVLPSAFGETWGLATNEALACSRPVLLSDRVGCARDIRDDSCSWMFSWDEPDSLRKAIRMLTQDRDKLIATRPTAFRRAWSFDISKTEEELMSAISRLR